MSIIKDGGGTGKSAKVTPDNRLDVSARSVDLSVQEAFEDDAYNINTEDITLTSANESGLLYLKNTGANDIVISAFFYLLGNSTGGSGDWLVEVYRNPTGGTLISGGSAIVGHNRNFGSNKALTATILKGTEGSTITGGTVAISSRLSSGGRKVVSIGAIILPRDKSVAVSVTPQTSNSSVKVQIAAAVYESTLEI